MKNLLKIILFFCTVMSTAQTKLELTPKGFEPIKIEMPNKLMSELINQSKEWAPYYNINGFDVFDVTQNSLSIEALNVNAYSNYNIGVRYWYDIKYNLKIVFDEDKKYTLTFTVKEIYTDKVPLKSKLTDFFTSGGKLKEDYKEIKPSLENTVNKIVNSYINFIAR